MVPSLNVVGISTSRESGDCLWREFKYPSLDVKFIHGVSLPIRTQDLSSYSLRIISKNEVNKLSFKFIKFL